MTLAAGARTGAAVALLALPTVLAFFSGGFFDEARLWAGLAACVLLAVAAVSSPLPRRHATWLALAAVAALAAWTYASAGWAPLAGPAIADAQRVALYAVALAAATLSLGAVPRLVEPILAAGCAVVVGYGLSGRFLPGLIELAASESAIGRLEQPLTYWNGMGALAALGLVLCARLAGDAGRPARLRAPAAAGAVVLQVGLLLSFSRGALAAAFAGLLILLALVPVAGQVRAVAAVVACGLPAAYAAVAFDGVRALEGSAGTRQWQGVVALAVLAALAAVAGLLAARPPGGAPVRRLRPVLAGLAIACLVATAAIAAVEEDGPATGATAARLASTGSNRYDYWAVAADAFAAQPLRGTGAGGFAVAWRRERTVAEGARDAHSLYLETAAELGVAGLLLLAALVGRGRPVGPARAGGRGGGPGGRTGGVGAARGAGLGLGAAGAHARRRPAGGRLSAAAEAAG